jgi:hypothetical protein
MTFQGLDLAPNHWAIVELDEFAAMTSFVVCTDIKSSFDRCPKGAAIYRPRPKKKKLETPNLHRFGLERLDDNATALARLFDRTCPRIVALEDYATSKEQGAHLLGENQGPVRLVLWRAGIEIALFTPQDIKMFAAHDGNASKEDVIDAVRERWDIDFEDYDPPNPGTRKPNIQTSGDLADAYVLARLAWTEDRLRRGRMKLTSLEHEKEVQVFNRTTKSRPVNRLGQDRLIRG